MSVSTPAISPTDYQKNFNPNNPYSDFYNTRGFAEGLDRNDDFYIQQSNRAQKRSEQEMNKAFNSDSQTPVIV